MNALPIWTPLASALLAFAWLIPNAYAPWSSFHKDAWVALMLLLVAGVFIVARKRNDKLFALDPLSSVLLLLACWSVLQWYSGKVFFLGHALIVASYFFAAGFALMLGRSWEADQPNAPGGFLFLAFLIGALGTSGIMLAQWLDISVNDVWISSVSVARRPYGNLFQPNNAATLLLLGLIALLWFYSKQRLSGAIAMLTGAYLLFFVALSGSRIGYVTSALLVLTVWGLSVRHSQLKPFRKPVLALGLLLPLIVLVLTSEWMNSSVYEMVGPKLTGRTFVSSRALLYQAYADAVWANPWWGNGAAQGAKTQLLAAQLGYQLPNLFTWSHNLFLDIATWFGLCALLLFIAALGVLGYSAWSAGFSMSRFAYAMAAAVFFAHSMVELPHAYAYFLLPSCMLVGAMTAGLRLPVVVLVRPVIGIAWAGLSVFLALTAWDYFRVESAFYTWRFKNANVGYVHAMDVPEPVVLRQFGSLLTGLRGSAESLTPEQLRDFEQAVLLYPSAAALQHLAEVQLLSGDVIGAERTVSRARSLTNAEERKAMAARWAYLGSVDSKYKAITWPE